MSWESFPRKSVLACVLCSVLLSAPLGSKAGLITQETDRPTKTAVGGGKNTLTGLEESSFAVPGTLTQDSSVAQAVATITHNATTRPEHEISFFSDNKGILFACILLGVLFLVAVLNVWRRRRSFAHHPYQGWLYHLRAFLYRIRLQLQSRDRRSPLARNWSARARDARPARSWRSSLKTWRSPSTKSGRSSSHRSRRSSSSKW